MFVNVCLLIQDTIARLYTLSSFSQSPGLGNTLEDGRDDEIDDHKGDDDACHDGSDENYCNYSHHPVDVDDGNRV